MRKWKIIAIIISVLAIGILFSSCGCDCSPYPESMAKFMPGQYGGGEMKYLIGKDTCSLSVGELLLPKGYRLSHKDLQWMDYCVSTATQSIGEENSYSINYKQRRAMEGIVVQYKIEIGYGEQQKDDGVQFSYDFEDTEISENHSLYEILPEYIAPTGKTYSNTLFFVDTYYKDSVWVSYNEGLVRYVPARADTTALGQVWQLL